MVPNEKMKTKIIQEQRNTMYNSTHILMKSSGRKEEHDCVVIGILQLEIKSSEKCI